MDIFTKKKDDLMKKCGVPALADSNEATGPFISSTTATAPVSVRFPA